MTNEELKKKIAQIIADYFCPQRNEHKNLWGDDRLCYSKTNFAECERVTECTDELIAAGIGDVSELKNHRVVAEYSLIPGDSNSYVLPDIPLRITQLYSGEEVEKIVKERDEYKHHAEVAERALKICLIDNRHCCECDMIDYKKCKGMDKDQKECAMLDIDDYIQRAEKELAGGRKDGKMR